MGEEKIRLVGQIFFGGLLVVWNMNFSFPYIGNNNLN
jgi:hypothetical protein